MILQKILSNNYQYFIQNVPNIYNKLCICKYIILFKEGTKWWTNTPDTL